MACCYKQSRACPESGALSGLWLATSDIPASKHIKAGGICYYFDDADASSLFCHGTLHTSYTTSTSCADCAACPTFASGCGACSASYTVTTHFPSGCMSAARPTWTVNQTLPTRCDWQASPDGLHAFQLACGQSYNTIVYTTWTIAVGVGSSFDVWDSGVAGPCPPSGTYTLAHDSGASCGAGNTPATMVI